MNLASAWKRTLQVGFVIAITTLAWFNLSASIMAVCAVVLAAFYSRLDTLVEFSFGPLKAKIERNLTESEILISRLKKFTAIQARAANSASVHTGRFASEDDWIFQSVKRVEAGLRELEIPEDEISEARSEFVRLTIRDAASAATGGSYVPGLGGDSEREWRELQDAKVIDPDAISAFLIRWNQLTPERVQRIEDIRWMMANNDVRDVEQYMRAHTSVPWEDGQV